MLWLSSIELGFAEKGDELDAAKINRNAGKNKREFIFRQRLMFKVYPLIFLTSNAKG